MRSLVYDFTCTYADVRSLPSPRAESNWWFQRLVRRPATEKVIHLVTLHFYFQGVTCVKVQANAYLMKRQIMPRIWFEEEANLNRIKYSVINKILFVRESNWIILEYRRERCVSRSEIVQTLQLIECLIFPFVSFVALKLRFISRLIILYPDFHRFRVHHFRWNMSSSCLLLAGCDGSECSHVVFVSSLNFINTIFRNFFLRI